MGIVQSNLLITKCFMVNGFYFHFHFDSQLKCFRSKYFDVAFEAAS